MSTLHFRRIWNQKKGRKWDRCSPLCQGQINGKTQGKRKVKPVRVTHCAIFGINNHQTSDCLFKKKSIENSMRKIFGYSCGIPGHKSLACRNKDKNNKNWQYVAINIQDETEIFLTQITVQKGKWIVVSGASHHMCNAKSFFCSIKTLENPRRIVLANDKVLETCLMGEVKLQLNCNSGS